MASSTSRIICKGQNFDPKENISSILVGQSLSGP